MSEFTTITSQAQYDRYKEARINCAKSYSEFAMERYNHLTVLIVEWDIKQDPSIIRSSRPKPLEPIEKEVIRIRASKHSAKKQKEKQ